MKTWITCLVEGKEAKDLQTLKSALDSAAVIRNNVTTGGNNRVFIMDPSLDAEPSAAYCRSHDVYSRCP
eukprot:678606-Amphidinium_carterae.1